MQCDCHGVFRGGYGSYSDLYTQQARQSATGGSKNTLQQSILTKIGTILNKILHKKQHSTKQRYIITQHRAQTRKKGPWALV